MRVGKRKWIITLGPRMFFADIFLFLSLHRTHAVDSLRMSHIYAVANVQPNDPPLCMNHGVSSVAFDW